MEKQMTQGQTFKKPSQIREWANTTVSKTIDNIIQVQHYKDGLYYYFAIDNDVYVYKMNSINPIGE